MTDLLQKFASEGGLQHPNRPPRDASTLILLDRSGPSPKVLLGRRHQGHVFVPGRMVFPGGGLDAGDRLMQTAAPLDPRTEAKLMRRIHRPNPTRARALALAAIRETFEETGLLLGVRRADAPAAPPGPWSAFADAKIHPDLSGIHFIARAITPPRRPRRYDTRFFAVDAGAVAHRVEGKVGPDAELVELIWLPLDEIGNIELMAITRLVLADLQERVAAGLSPDLPVPFYRVTHGKRLRELL